MVAHLPPRQPLHFTVEGKIVPKGRPRFSRGHTYTPERTVNYEGYMQWSLKSLRPVKYMGAISIELTAYFKVPKGKEYLIQFPCLKRPDLDNIIKCLDAYNGILWEDDSQIVHIEASKKWGITERLEITVNYL